MCLLSIGGTPKKTEGLGWKVFRVRDNGDIFPGNRGNAAYEYEKWYGSRTYWEGQGYYWTERLETESVTYPKPTYANGFHVALRREDARDFVRRINEDGYRGNKFVIRQVEYRGAHTEGQGNPRYFGGPQVIANEIKILKPRAGGSAYAKAKKVEKQIPAPEA